MLSILSNKDRHELRLYIPFSVLIFFVITRYIGFSGLTIYPTIDRATAVILFQRTVTTSLSYDHMVIVAAGLVTLYFLISNKKIIPVLAAFGVLQFYLYYNSQVALDIFALLMMPAIISIVVSSHFAKKRLVKQHKWKNLLYVSTAVAFCFEFFIISEWIVYPFFPQFFRGSAIWHPVALEYDLFYAFARIAPVFLIFASYSFLTKLVQRTVHEFFKSKLRYTGKQGSTEEVQKRVLQLQSKLETVTSMTKKLGWSERFFGLHYVEKIKNAITLEKTRLEDSSFRPNVVFSPKIMLAVAFGISIVFAFYPYLPTINPHYTWVSVDDFNYQQFLNQMHQQQTIQEKLQEAFVISSGDRPLTLILMYSFQHSLGLDVMTAVRFFALFLGPGLVLGVYFFVREGTKSKHQAAYAALLTAFSHQVIVGIYAGFFANWLGLVAAYLAFLMIHRFWQRPSVKNYLFVFGHSVLSFLMYVYVDVYFLLTLLVFLILSTIKYRHVSAEKKKILILASIFAVYAAVFVLRIFLGSTGLFDTVFGREDVTLSYREFANRWTNFPYFMHYYVGGFLTNAAILVFAFVWTFYAKYEKTFDRILLASLFAGALPLVFGDEVLQSRVYYDMPVHIVAAIAIWRILNRNDINPLFAKTAFSLVTIHFAIYAIRSLSNLNLSGIS
ncbi:MAG: hypothetical protein ACT4N1_00005 [Nitrososphaerota archaeon]